MGKIKRRALFRPEFHVLLISTDEQALPLLAQIIFTIAIRDRRQATIGGFNLCDAFSHEILMLCRLQR